MKNKRVLAIASGGGHWQQLMLMRPAWDHHDVLFLTTLPGLADQFDAHPNALVPDCNRDNKLAIIKCSFVLAYQLIRFRPHVVISTGALPGVITLALAKMMHSKTIWVDSVANAEEMSMSGRLARRFADLWLSQWEDVAKAAGAEFAGAVL